MLGQKKCFPNLWGILLFFLIILKTIYPQDNSAVIKGKIIDISTNEPLQGAVVLAQNTGSGAVSDYNGNFLIKVLHPGNYQITATLIGYKPIIEENVTASNVNTTGINLNMSKDVLLMPEVKINGDRNKSTTYELTSINQLSYNEISTTPGNFNDVVRSVSVLPGVGRADQFRNDMVVRGGSPSENLVVINDLPVPNINHYGNQGSTGGAVSFIDLDYVKSASLSTGGFSAAYGDKLSSVLNLELRNGRSDHVSGKVVLSFLGLGVSTEGPINNNTTFILSARKSYLDMAFKLSGFIFTPEYYDFFSNVYTKLPGNTSLSFLLLGSLDNVKIFNSSIDERKNNPLAIGSREFNYVGGVVLKKITRNEIYTMSLSRNSNYYKTFPNFFFDNKSAEIENILKGSIVKKFSKNDELNLGFTGKIINFQTKFSIKENGINYAGKSRNDSSDMRSNFYKFNFFTQYNHEFNNGASVIAGLRYDYFNPLRNDFTISPRLSISFPLTGMLKSYFSTGIYYQTPSYLWLAGNPENKHLKSLRADHYIGGIDFLAGDYTVLNIEGYYKFYRDYPVSLTRPYIILSNTGASFSGIDDNFEGYGLEPLISRGRGLSKGICMQIKSNFPGSLYHLLFNINFSNTSFRSVNGITRLSSYDQKWIINLLAGYRFNESLKLNIRFSYASGKPYTPFDQSGKPDIAKYNSVRFPAQHSLDVRIDKEWKLSELKITTFLDIQNIYNRKNKNYIRWDRKLNQIAKDPVMGVLPSIGFSTEL